MDFVLERTEFFREQIGELSYESLCVIEKRLNLLKINPFRNKCIKGHGMLLLRIRFMDMSKEKKIIYTVQGHAVKLLCIIDRDNEYRDLKSYLRRLGY